MKDHLDAHLPPQALKGMATTLAYLDPLYRKMGETVAFLREMLKLNGYASNNGAAPTPPPRTDEDAAKIVAGAKEMFQKRRPRRVARRSPAEWQAAILQVLTDANGPVAGIDIGKVLSPNTRSGNFFGHINAALKKKLIVQVNDSKPALYALAKGAARHAKAKRSGGFSHEKIAQREKTAKLLAHFDTDEPRGVPAGTIAQAVGVLVQHGHLKKHSYGQYLRTGKVFEVHR